MEKRYSREMRGGDGGRSQFYLFDRNIFNDYKVDGECSVGETTPIVLVN
jgi:hypothetical protein